MTQPGHLYGIGVGPGDPELMTLKAVRLLDRVAVVAYLGPEGGDSSARAIAAEFIPAGRTEIAIAMPMRPGREPVEIYDKAAGEIAAHLEDGRDVAVLCEGDPFFYGSFMYLHDRLGGRFPCTIVPGIASITACAAAAAVPLVRRDATLTVLPATLDDPSLEARLANADAAAIMKVGRHLARIRALLERLGRIEGAFYVERATRPDQRVRPLAQLAAPDAPYFSMILLPERSKS
ncbi:precorrin-2/cobalt-factor-2 C20-methyltransferase [Faunimonas pinastri]|uniref:Precorrin-2/cobalt-factor-2 C20-methyltransferase n=1 Tax=Faunimonas pinastri TaxID=1855383 RepID=A0A1H9LYK1_9HYPH|nr:precorrin-2 C(20)-methyltransferase [Faunimonas pinastri]SER16478.1 precorrin-2/cobalt-factor-2 C20-methyltransferase [Faunimonas pinastri]